MGLTCIVYHIRLEHESQYPERADRYDTYALGLRCCETKRN
jgi:hypothetical protein